MKQKFLVPYKTAQALKAAGYNEECKDWYDDNGVLWSNNYFEPNNSDLAEMHSAAPTYHEVVDWLESKDIIVIADLDIGFDEVDVNDKWISMFWYDNKKKINPTDFHYKTREEALNAAILKALEGLQ